jgi:hypothetical protein
MMVIDFVCMPASRRSLSSKARIVRMTKQAPPSLLGVVEVLVSNPSKAFLILEREIQHRAEFILLAEQARRFVWWRFTDALQGFVVTSILIVSALWTFRGLTRVREWMDGIDPRVLPGGETMFKQWYSLFVYSPLVSWPWQLLAVVATFTVVGLFARYLGILLFSWREFSPLKVAARSREEEIQVLRGWREKLEA